MGRPVSRLVLRPSWRGEIDAGFAVGEDAVPDAILCGRQVHGADVFVLEGGARTGPPAGDGLFTSERGVAVAVRVADCCPILLWAPTLPAVGAVHAGWRGTALGIAPRAVNMLPDVAAAAVRVAIGPSIGPCCFEVGDEVVDALRATGIGDGDFCLRTGPRGRPHVDLRAANRAQLVDAGVPAEQIEFVGGCTSCSPLLPSYRRDGPRAARMRGFARLLALFVIVGAIPGCARRDTLAPEADVDAARALLDRQDWAAAAKAYRRLARRYPDDALVRASRAEALLRLGRYDEAAAQNLRALAADPALWPAAWNAAAAFTALGDADAALGWLGPALAASGRGPGDVAADPDLAALTEDHRVAAFLQTGVLASGPWDAALRLESLGADRFGLTLSALWFNRDLLARAERLSLDPGPGTVPQGLTPLLRTERSARLEAAGREVLHTEVRYEFLAQGAIPARLGPFRIEIGDRVVRGDALVLPPVRDARDGFDATSFFAVPTGDDAALFDGVADGTAAVRDGAVVTVFRAEADGSVPATLAPPPRGTWRSLRLRLPAEGPSTSIDRPLSPVGSPAIRAAAPPSPASAAAAAGAR
jgi:YfiH family protein